MKTRYQSNTRHDTIWGWFRICCLILELKERRSFSPASSRWSYPDRSSTKVTSFTSVLTSVHSVFTTVNWSFGLEKETFYLFKVNMGSKWCRHLVLMCLSAAVEHLDPHSLKCLQVKYEIPVKPRCFWLSPYFNQSCLHMETWRKHEVNSASFHPSSAVSLSNMGACLDTCLSSGC